MSSQIEYTLSVICYDLYITLQEMKVMHHVATVQGNITTCVNYRKKIVDIKSSLLYVCSHMLIINNMVLSD